jgi:hypothetical protein
MASVQSIPSPPTLGVEHDELRIGDEAGGDRQDLRN